MNNKADLEEIRDYLQSEIACCRERINGIYNNLNDLYEFKGKISTNVKNIENRVENIEKKLDKIYNILLSVFITIVVAALTKLLGWW